MIFDFDGNAIAGAAEAASDIGLHTRPKSNGQLNAIKRARQFTDLRWIPAADFDRVEMPRPRTSTYAFGGYCGKFLADREYIGVPYSHKHSLGVEQMHRNQELGVALDTFATSVRTLGSAQLTQSDYDYSASAERYNASYYGATCVNLVCYALDIPYITSGMYPKYPYGSTKTSHFTSHHLVSEGLFDAELELADVLQTDGHVAIVTDIIRDDNGMVSYVEVSESTQGGVENTSNPGGKYGGKAQRIMWSRADFAELFGNYTVLKYQYLESVQYIPNAYAPIAGEGERYAVTDFPLIPYYGHRCVIAPSSGSTVPVKLMIRANCFTHVKKASGSGYEPEESEYNGLLLVPIPTGTTILSSLDDAQTDSQGNRYITIDVQAEEPQIYRACLVIKDNSNNILHDTVPSEFCVMPPPKAHVTKDGSDIKVQIERGSHGFYPWGFRDVTNNSYPRRVFRDALTQKTANGVPIWEFVVSASANTSGIRLSMRSDVFGSITYGYDVPSNTL